MTTKETIEALKKLGVLTIIKDSENRWYVEDSESYYGFAYITFDKDGNAIKVDQKHPF